MVLPRTPEPEAMDSAEEAEDYDTMDHAEVNSQFVNDYLAFARLNLTEPGDQSPYVVLDIGTGTAQIPILLSSRLTVRHVVLACDVSSEMLQVALRNITAAGCPQTVLPCHCNARQLPLPDQSCHQLISNSIVHHIPQPLDVFAETRRVAAPGGIVFFRDLLRPDSADDVERLVHKWGGGSNGTPAADVPGIFTCGSDGA